jgi:uncharacterized protein
MIFVDASIWYAAYVDEDAGHERALTLLAKPNDRLVTTDYVVDELLTLMVARNQKAVARKVGVSLLSGQLCEIVWISRDDVRGAWQVFNGFEDKAWSFTDCISCVVMQRLGVTQAFALDEHFKQFGFVSVLP